MSTGLVTIGIPTYNRVALLRRAVASALGQDHPTIEVVISDNASSDGTARFCRQLADTDPRVRYLRQTENLGATRNFRAVLGAARGDYFMWLGDDDVLAANYVSECVNALHADPGTALVAGRPYMVGDGGGFSDVSVNLLGDDGAARVLGYYRSVTRNSVFSGVGRTAVMQSLPALENVVGGDWLFLAGVAFGGRVRTLDTTTLRCSSEGDSDDLRRAARSMGLGRLAGTCPRVALCVNIAHDLLHSATYHGLGRRERASLAVRCTLSAGWRVGVRYHSVRTLRALVGRLGPRRQERPRPVPVGDVELPDVGPGDPDGRVVPPQPAGGRRHEPV